jgi:hypothetical protein
MVELVATALVKYGPALAKGLYDLFRTENPTPQQWAALFELAEKKYEDYVRPAGPVVPPGRSASPPVGPN